MVSARCDISNQKTGKKLDKPVGITNTKKKTKKKTQKNNKVNNNNEVSTIFENKSQKEIVQRQPRRSM